MNGRLALFSKAAVRFARPQTRKLFTENIYPYPHEYISKTKYPSHFCYRETWHPPFWAGKDARWAYWGWRSFWTWFFYQLFTKPEAITGHGNFPSPKLWTDAELGIPPDEEGSYYDWLDQQEEAS